MVDDGYWVVVRVDRIHCKVIVADPRELIVKHRHPLVKPLVNALTKCKKRKWETEAIAVDDLPRSGEKLYSAILACLNIGCWAVFKNKKQLELQLYTEVFTYSTDNHFMLKARHFISRVIYEYGKHRRELVAVRVV